MGDEAVSTVSSVDEITAQIVADIPLAKEKIKTKKRMKLWEIIFLALVSPVWLSLLIAAFAVIFSLYVVIWSVIISLWAVLGSFIGCTLGGIAFGIRFVLSGTGLTGIALIGAGFVCAGLSVFLFCGCKAATKGMVLLTKKIALGIKDGFVKKGEA